jgi:hypothetical protein
MIQKQHQSAGAQIAPRPQTQVEAFLSELVGSLDGLEKAIERHAERIEPVLRAQEPTKGEVGTPDEMLVPVADRIRSQVKRVVFLRERLENLTTRTEA